MAKKRTIKTNTVVVKKKIEKRCIVHDSVLVFNIDRHRWLCPEKGCATAILPETSVTDTIAPTIAAGPVKIIKFGKDYALWAPENNVLFPLEGYIVSASLDPAGLDITLAIPAANVVASQ